MALHACLRLRDTRAVRNVLGNVYLITKISSEEREQLDSSGGALSQGASEATDTLV